MRFHAIALAAALLVPATCRAAAYTLTPEDVLTVSVYGHDDLSREVMVLNDGHFNYPIVGRVNAGGQSAEQVAAAISKGLEKELNAPQVTVTVKQPAMRRVYAGGLLARAGSYDIKPGWRVSHLIAEAGGITGRADLARATIVRGDENIPVDLNAVLSESSREADIALEPGDLLQVQPDTNLIHIVGQAKVPGDYQVKKSVSVLEAVAMAGGTSDTAALTRAQILRGTQVIKVDLHAILLGGDTGGNVTLQPGDTLVIPANEQRIAVLGGVQQPGYYDLPDGKAVTLADAVAMAHGANKKAKLDSVALVREVNGKQVVSKLDLGSFLKKGDLAQNPTVQTGDVVYITDGRDGLDVSQIFAAAITLANPFVGSLIKR